jgi:hypothetical protein
VSQHDDDPRLDPDFLEREGLDRATVEAVGKLSAAFETIEVARGLLYQFHRLTGTADFEVEEAVRRLREAGHGEFADRLDEKLLGRNLLTGRWTFQIVEEFEATYYEPFQGLERESRALVNGYRHVYEASLKRDRTSPREPGHEISPAEADSEKTGPAEAG